MFHSLQRFHALLLVAALLFAVIIQIPQLLHMADTRFRGVLVQLNSDEDVYLARVQEALNGRPEQSAEAFVGDPQLKGSQPALLERIVGTVFRPTGWRAATVLQVMDSITVFFLVLVLFLFFRQCGFSRWPSYLGTVLFSAIELYNLNRPIHQGLSAVLLLLAINGIIVGLRSCILFGVIGGIALGLLFGDYFWSWSFGWLWAGLLLLWTLFEGMRTRTWAEFSRAVLFCVIGLITATPFFIEFLSLLYHPLYPQAMFRSGMHPSRFPESWAYSVLFLLVIAGILLSVWTSPPIRRYRYAIVTVVTAFLVIHQQVIHGFVFNFVSHYLFFLGVAALCTVLLWHAVRNRFLLLSVFAALIYLAAIAYDGRHIVKQFTVQASRFSEQHFATLLPVLDALPRATILSDPETEHFIAGSSHHDVVYSLYLKNVLMTHEEVARRFCLTQVPVPSADRHLDALQPIYPDANSAFNDDSSVREKERQIVAAACVAADHDPAATLNAFNVRYILWDERRRPEWNLRRLHLPLRKISSGDGWSLWQVSGLG